MSDVQLLRARRRYRALLREANELEERGQKDETVDLELEKLECEYPVLKEIRGPVKEISSMGSNNTKTETKEKQSCEDVSHPILTTGNSPGPVRNASVGSSMVTESLSRDESNQRSNDIPKQDRPEIVPSLGRGVNFVFSALSLWNEAHLPSSLSISSYLIILAITIGIAFLHMHGIDPNTPYGRFFSPVLFASLVHIGTLFSIHLKSPGRISKAMLLIYFVFDYLPSLVFIFVVYVLAGIGIRYMEYPLLN
ncbi:uncharacterized protein TM35_000062220 [Trypanosoma theileri]|uniref:Uncharacterized protein n=1 Tax=Trypanosoma theileri TaxID=67003 RepID=A0A1X0P2R1_9TRYP|nr:uncharacterized protein TM35_000062220 [Trypanosoma theileri]ORC91217.1 hypothetical protein TM35_000062220 [Trypanosoma theileri]